MPEHVIRAAFTDRTVRVYQAYRPEIALAALESGRFVPPFRMGRMTWIKPSLNWMMYRSGYGSKEGQEYVLGIDITRAGFEWALERGVLSSYHHLLHGSPEEWKARLARTPVRIQWDPERDWRLNVVEGVRAIQIGLAGEAVERFVQEWIVAIEDVSPIAATLREAAQTDVSQPPIPLPVEAPYPLPQGFNPAIFPRG